MDNAFFMVEMVFKKRQIGEMPERFQSLVDRYKQFESEDRLILDVPVQWDGFRDGTIIELLKEFNEGVYVALAYFTSGMEAVTDFSGNRVDRFETVFDGRRMLKYVKKKLRIVTVGDGKDFEVKGYLLDLKFCEPVVKVLDVYSCGDQSGVTVKDFCNEDNVA